MSLVALIVVVAIIGFVAWVVLQIPMPVQIRNILIGVIILFTVIWILQSFGLITGLPSLRLK